MKKIIISIICSLSIITTSNAFFGSPTSIDLYKNIDSGIEKLNSNILTIELDETFKNINKLASLRNMPECLDETKKISEKEFNKIISNNEVLSISKYIKASCKSDEDLDNGSISIQLLNNYLTLFKDFKTKSLNISDKKTNYIYKISNIGLYSDGIVANSGFDLIKDIEEIDKIIFANVVDYKGVENLDLGDTINDSLKNITKSMNDFLYPELLTKEDIKNNNIEKSPPINKENSINIISTQNTYICKDESDKSGLSNESINFLLNNIAINTSDENNLILDENINNNGNGGNSEGNNNLASGSYNPVNDNSIWPCDTFFCIKVDFIKYNHSLFGGGENITIEYLLNRSNKHLGKFAGTSLIPAKMSTNNFELGLSNLNLPDLFHIGFQISSRPVPILNLQKQGKVDESEFASKNMLEKYYEANGMDYKRRNDLSLFGKEEQDKQNILNGTNLTVKEIIKRNNEYLQNYEEKNKEITLLEKIIEKKVSYGTTKTFERQYTEIEIFTKGINQYVKNIKSIISAMKEIPTDKG